MKKMVCFTLAVIMAIYISVPVYATEAVQNAETTSHSYYNSEGEIVTVTTVRRENSSTAKVYVNGILTQKSIANGVTQTIETVIYDLPVSMRSAVQAEKGTCNGFTTIVTHSPISSERITVAAPEAQSRSVDDEPVDNTGLSESVYGDGYYFLGSLGNFYYAPNLYGYLFRIYTCTYDGETHYWSWDEGDTVAAITAYVVLCSGPVGAVLSALKFTVDQVLEYNQSVELATYTFDYHYKVRVKMQIHFTAERNVTYWRIDNVTEGTTRWDEKRFNYGFSMGNEEMVKFGIDNYLLANNE